MESYQAPWGLGTGHLATIVPHLLRNTEPSGYFRERISLPDGDFLDLDHSTPQLGPSKPHFLLLHGLEGNSRSGYIVSVGQFLRRMGYSFTAINYRGCGGDPNLLPRFYHSGATEDVAATVNHLKSNGIDQLVLIGFSLGGNQCLKFMGELNNRWADFEDIVKSGIAFSVPLDLATCSDKISEPGNLIYERRFIKSLSNKVLTKHLLMPNEQGLNPEKLSAIKTLRDFDNWYTAPLHGYPDAATYYAANSSKDFLRHINKPSLLVQSDNDPFLTDEVKLVRYEKASLLQVITTRSGGHCGWLKTNANNGSYYWFNDVILGWVERNL